MTVGMYKRQRLDFKKIYRYLIRTTAVPAAACLLLLCPAGTAFANDVTPPTMTTIPQPQGQYYNTTPILSLQFQDETQLWSVEYQIDGYVEGSWTYIINNWATNTWSQPAWSMPNGFSTLIEGSHTIYFRATDKTGNKAGQNGEWKWQFYKDTTGPTPPGNLTSTSHVKEVWYPLNQITVTWEDSTDVGSGLSGYSFVWDNSPGTIPPTTKIIGTEVETTTSPVLADGALHYFHIRAVDKTGNWGETAHLGPFWIDTENPTMDAIPTPEGQFYNTAPVLPLGFHDNLALDDGYYQLDSFTGTWIAIFNNATGESWTATNWTIPNFSNLNDGEHTIYFKVTDDAGHSVGDNGERKWVFKKDTTPPPIPNSLVSTSHTISHWSSDQSIKVTWIDSVDAYSGLNGYAVIWDTSSDTTPEPIINLAPGIRQSESPDMPSSDSIYFHIRPADKAGNWGTTVHLGPFKVDVTPPGKPDNVHSTSHTTAWSADNTIDIAWSDATDNHSGLDGYSFVFDNNATTIPDEIKDVEEDVRGCTSQPLADSKTIYFHIRAIDNLNNPGETVHVGPYYIDTTPPEITPILEEENKYYSIAPSFSNLKFTDNLAIGQGWYQIDSTTGQWQTIFSEAAGTAWTRSGWTLPDFINLVDGLHTVYFRASDDCGNTAGGSEWSWSFYKDTVAPSLPTSLQSTSHSLQTWSKDNTIDVKWEPASDTLSGLAGYSYIWNQNPTADPDEIVNTGAEIKKLTSPPLPDGNNLYFHIRAVDVAGNWTETVHLGPFYIDTELPQMNTVAAIAGQYHNTAPVFSTFKFTDNISLREVWYQIDSYKGTWNNLLSSGIDSTWQQDGWKIPGFDTLSEGSHTIFFKAADHAGNISGGSGEWSYQFFKDSVAPTPPSNLNPQSHIVGRWSNNNIVEIKWSAGTDVTSGIGGYSLIWDQQPETIPDKTVNITANILQTKSHALNDGYNNFFHIRSVDNAGNWSEAVHMGPFAIDTREPETITDLEIINTARKSVTLSWTVPEDNLTECSSYDIRYSTAPITPENWDVASRATGEPEPMPAGKTDRFQVTGLTTNVTYYFAMKTSDGVNNISAISNTVCTTTRNSPPDLHWVVSPERAYNANALTFAVTYSDVEGDAPTSVTVTIDGGTPENLALKPGQEIDYVKGVVYQWVTSAAGLSPGYHSIKFSAHDGIDEAVTGAEATDALYVLSSIVHQVDDITDEGKFTEDITLSSQDEVLHLVIDKDTLAIDLEGSPLNSISIREVKLPPTLPEATYYVGPVFELGPEGARFEPGITIIMDYSLFSLPEGADESCLFFAVYDESTRQWIDIPCIVDAEAGTVTLQTTHFSMYSLLARTASAKLEVTDLQISPSIIGSGRTLMITATITNSGNLEGTYPAELLINGSPVTTKNVTVEGGDTAIAVFEITAGDTGEYIATVGTISRSFTVRMPIPATISATSLEISGTEFTTGQPVAITAVVTNTGDEAGTYPVNIEVDGAVVQTITASCAPGQSTEIVFEISFDTPGNHIISVDGITESISVANANTPEINSSIIVTLLELSALEAKPGEEISVLALLTAIENNLSVQEIPIIVNDEVYTTDTVDFTSGQTQELAFTVSFDEAGEYIITIGSVSETLTITEGGLLSTSNLMLLAVLVFVTCAGLLVFLRVRSHGSAWLKKYFKFLPFFKEKGEEPGDIIEQISAGEKIPEKLITTDNEVKTSTGRSSIWQPVLIGINRFVSNVKNRFHRHKSEPEPAGENMGESRNKNTSLFLHIFHLPVDFFKRLTARKKKEKSPQGERHPEEALLQVTTGMDFQEQQEYEQAMACYLKAIELDPQSAEAHGSLGLLYQEKDDLKRAIAEYNKALDLNPNLVEAYGNRALINKALGNRQLAIADFEKFISMIDDPEYIEIAKKQIAELQT